jgi:hypothetical protein
MAEYLPLSINPTLSNYLGYITVYQLDKTSRIFGSIYPLNNTATQDSLTAIYLNNTISFTPMVVNDSSSFWFVSPLYTPNKWIVSDLYQQKTNDIKNQFIFTGSFRSNTLYTKYATPSNYTVNAFIKAFNSDFSSLLASVTSPINQTGNFNIQLDTTSLTDIANLQWGFTMNGFPVYPSEKGNQGSVIIGEVYPCFKEGSKILTDQGYKLIQDLRKGDFVKTLNHGFISLDLIGKREIHHPASKERIKDQLYQCSQDHFEEVFEPLIITGCHSILVDDFVSNEQREKVIEVNGDTYVTDGKYRLPACADPRASIYEIPGNYTIYHLALENDDYYMNYGIYANGLLVETCSKRYLKELSNMELIE